MKESQETEERLRKCWDLSAKKNKKMASHAFLFLGIVIGLAMGQSLPIGGWSGTVNIVPFL